MSIGITPASDCFKRKQAELKRPIHGGGIGKRSQEIRVSSWMMLEICSQQGNKLYFKDWFKLGFQKHPPII